MSSSIEVRKVLSQAAEGGYFKPVCTARHLFVRYYNWETSRYLGDATHLVALLLCLATILREEGGTQGVSLKTHVLFFFVYSTRFLNIFFCTQAIYLIIYKVVVWQATAMIVTLMFIRGANDDRKDTMPVGMIVLPILMLTLVFGRYSVDDHGLFAEVGWIFSMYLEAVAMVPQYIYCYRDPENRSCLVFLYVVTMSGYRVIFGVSWAYHFLFASTYLDTSSLISGVLGIVFFSDYLLFKLARRSALSELCISVDEGFREAREAARDAMMGATESEPKQWQAIRRAAELAAAEEGLCQAGKDFQPPSGTQPRRPSMFGHSLEGTTHAEIEMQTSQAPGARTPMGRPPHSKSNTPSIFHASPTAAMASPWNQPFPPL